MPVHCQNDSKSRISTTGLEYKKLKGDIIMIIQRDSHAWGYVVLGSIPVPGKPELATALEKKKLK